MGERRAYNRERGRAWERGRERGGENRDRKGGKGSTKGIFMPGTASCIESLLWVVWLTIYSILSGDNGCRIWHNARLPETYGFSLKTTKKSCPRYIIIVTGKVGRGKSFTWWRIEQQHKKSQQEEENYPMPSAGASCINGHSFLLASLLLLSFHIFPQCYPRLTQGILLCDQKGVCQSPFSHSGVQFQGCTLACDFIDNDTH